MPPLSLSRCGAAVLVLISVACSGSGGGSPVVTPGQTVSVVAERSSVWANGIEPVQIAVGVRNTAGQPVAGVAVQVRTTARGVAFAPATPQSTGADGLARFEMTSAMLGAVAIEGFATADPSRAARVVVDAVRRRIGILVQGIRSSLVPGASPAWPELVDALVGAGWQRPVRGAAEAQAEWNDGLDNDGDGAVDDGGPLLFDYSYRGGAVGVTHGAWLPAAYSCSDTAQAIATSASLLAEMLDAVARANPNTGLDVIGHSQGGLIALQALNGVLAPSPSPGTLALETVATLDGALGGTPPFETWITQVFTCWGGAAAADLRAFWSTATDHTRQGTTARSLAGVAHEDLVQLAAAAGIRTLTLGSRQDCVFRPQACGPPLTDNSSTQIIDTAAGGLRDFGAACLWLPTINTCVQDSHAAVLRDPTAQTELLTFLR